MKLKSAQNIFAGEISSRDPSEGLQDCNSCIQSPGILVCLIKLTVSLILLSTCLFRPDNCFDFWSGIRLSISICHTIWKLACLDFPFVNFINSVVCRKDVVCWQAPFTKMAMLKVKEDIISDCKLVFCF